MIKDNINLEEKNTEAKDKNPKVVISFVITCVK